jgi:uncharacterized protein
MEKLIGYILEEFDNDRKMVEHTMKVYAYSRLIGLSENLSPKDQQILETAALLHDIGIPSAKREYGSSAGPNQEKTGAIISKRILDEINPDISAPVSHIVGHHHSFDYDGGILLTIIFEADALVNLSEKNMPISSINSVKANVFKTTLGTKLLDGIFYKEFNQ